MKRRCASKRVGLYLSGSAALTRQPALMSRLHGSTLPGRWATTLPHQMLKSNTSSQHPVEDCKAPIISSLENGRPITTEVTFEALRRDEENASRRTPLQPRIHPSAVVDPTSAFGNGVRIGPFCVVGPYAVLGDGVCLHSHVVVNGHTTIGEDTQVFAHATVGAVPHDRKHLQGEQSELHVGRRCKIFEYAHISSGTRHGGGVTSVGDDCMLMSHTHVGHDCDLGENVVLASGSALAGHVVVGDHAIISGHSCVHQRVAIGRGAFVAGASVLVNDLIPYGVAIGNRAHLYSLNLRGLRRGYVSALEQRAMLRAFRFLFQLPAQHYYEPLPLPAGSSLQERAQELQLSRSGHNPHVVAMANFVLGARPRHSTRPLCLPACPHL